MPRAQLIPNGDWETGVASGWTLTPGSGGGVCELSSADPYNGKWHLRIGTAAGGGDSTATFSSPDAVALVGFTIEFQVRHKKKTGDSGVAPLNIRITDSSGSTSTLLNPGGAAPSTYTFATVQRTIVAGSTIVTFTIIVTGGAVDIGQFEIDAMVCENPLVGAGVGGSEDLGGAEEDLTSGFLDNATRPPLTLPPPGAPLFVPDAEQGSIIYRNAFMWVTLPPGVHGETLMTQGPGANPIWSAGIGRVFVQVQFVVLIPTWAAVVATLVDQAYPQTVAFSVLILTMTPVAATLSDTSYPQTVTMAPVMPTWGVTAVLT